MPELRVEEHSDGTWYVFIDGKQVDEIQGSVYDAVYQAQANNGGEPSDVEVVELDGYTFVMNLV